MGLQITIRESGDVVILDLRGKSTLSPGESELLSSWLQKLQANGVLRFLLNLTDLTQIDSSSVSIIVKTYFYVCAKGGDLRVLRPTGQVLEVLKALHLFEIIYCYKDETEALASFQRGYSTH